MNHRDHQIIGKILAEIDVAGEMLNGISEAGFLTDEKQRVQGLRR